jgi:leukotriene-A4 hydrolase
MHRPPPSKLAALALLGSIACASGGQTKSAASAPKKEAIAFVADPHSFSRPEEARVTHVALDLRPDFEAKVMHGTAVLTIEAKPDAQKIVLDTKHLSIESVTDETGLPLEHDLGPEDPLLGSALSVALGPAVRTLAIRYHTAPDAAAFLWLEPEQTPGKKHKFLFTQGQSILTRTWIPLQDSPQVRATYEARVTVPKGLTAVMSAERKKADGQDSSTFAFAMTEPIPSYLIALAAGDLVWRSLGPRTGVYADPAMIDAAAHELADVEKMVAAAETLYGPYRWGRYDMLLLPPSFPYGGMENPRVTFASPTIIAGDRSLIALIAHELAHAWSGNLVTNATWSDLWLNEGITVYIERRISEQLYGPDYREMIEALGRDSLDTELQEMGLDSWKARLHPDLQGKDPDDNVTAVPYEKGALLMELLEREIGRGRLDAFLKRYFDRFAFHSMTTDGFVELMKRDLFANDPETPAKIDLDGWISQPGIPANAPALASKRLERVVSEVDAFAKSGALPSTSKDPKARYGALEWMYFFRKLPKAIPVDRLAAIDRAFHFSESTNAELRFEWLRIAVANRYEPALKTIESFLESQGRQILVLPLYKDLLATEWGAPIAQRAYGRARPFYHALTRVAVEDAFTKAGKR